MINRVSVNINTNGLNRPSKSKDGYAGLLFRPANLTGLTLPSAVFSITSLKQAEGYGIIAASPTFGKYHSIIKDFFTGTTYFDKPAKLFISVGNASDSYKDGLDLLMGVDGGSEIKMVIYPTFATYDEGTIVAITNAHKDYPFTPLITLYAPLGLGADKMLADYPDLKNISYSVKDHPDVMVVWGTDQSRVNTYGSGVGPAVGAVAGFLAGVDVATNPANRLLSNNGYADIFNMNIPVLYTEDKDNYVTPVSADWSPEECTILLEKGINYFDYVPNKPGIFLSGDYTVTTSTNDLQTVHLTRTLWKAKRECQAILENYPHSKTRTNPDGSLHIMGWMPIEVSLVSTLTKMVNAGEISDFKIGENSTTDVTYILNKIVKANVSVLPMESIEYIDLGLGYAVN